jgi:serine/threonine protein kinase
MKMNGNDWLLRKNAIDDCGIISVGGVSANLPGEANAKADEVDAQNVQAEDAKSEGSKAEEPKAEDVEPINIFCPKCETVFNDQSGADSTVCTNCGLPMLLSKQTNRKDENEIDEPPEQVPTRDLAGSTVDSAQIYGVPVQLEQYRLIRLIGTGGFAHVFLATDMTTKKRFAIKIPRTDRKLSEAQFTRFLDEARTHSSLKHSGIVGVKEVNKDSESGQDFIVMDYIEGRTLNELLKESAPLPPEDAAIMMSKIAKAVQFAHTQQVFHRDLKPSNILLDKSDNPYVADFGLALHEDQQSTHEGEVAGTLPYMAPEQVNGDVHRLDGRSDIWSLGVIFYSMLTGRLPFRGAAPDLATDILERDPRPPRQIENSVPHQLDRICLRCLEKPVTRRFSAAIDLSDELEQWIRDKDASPRWRLPTVLAFTALAVALAVSVAAFVISKPVNTFELDSFAKVGKWYSMMETEPQVICGPGEMDLLRDPDGKVMDVNSPQTAMLALGETNSSDFTMRIKIKKTRWFGSTGFFWGYSKDSPNAHILKIRVSPNAEGYRWEIIRYTRDIVNGITNAERRCGQCTVTAINHGNSVVLEVQIKDNKMICFKWNNNSKYRWNPTRKNPDGPEIADANREENKRPSHGKFGVFTQGSDTVFQDGEIMLNKTN